MKIIKQILQLITGIIFMPFLILGACITVFRLIICVPIEFAWTISKDWYWGAFKALNDYINWIKK